MVAGHYYLLITLVTAHIVSDFFLQTKKDVKNKNHYSVFIKHILIVALLSYLFIGIWTAWLIPVIIAVTHAVIDKIKLALNSGKFNDWQSFTLDQVFHLIVIGLVAVIFGANEPAQSFWLDKFGNSFLEANIYISGVILTVLTGGIIVGMMVKPFLDQIGVEQNGLKNGGELIGRLERVLIFFFVLYGEITAIGFLVAAKSIYRFGELTNSENRKQAEYILIGTLYSFSWAFILSWFTQKVAETI